MTSSRSRLLDLDLAKGLGIILVVFGHIAAKQQSAGNVWYTFAQAAVYTFHMPFFLYLSGYVAYMTGAARTSPAKWPKLAFRRAERLLLPFMAMGVVLVSGKLLASHFMYVDNSPDNAANAFINLLWNTDASPAISIWYMFIIFLAALVTPVFFWLGRGSSLAPLIVAAVLFYFGLPHYIFADRFAEYYLFFILGGVAADIGAQWLIFLDKYKWIAMCLLPITIAYLFSLDSFAPHWSHLICGIISIPALHGLVRSHFFENSRTLAYFGTYSFVIYLLNTPVMGIVKGALLKWVSWDGPGFLVVAISMLVSGLLVPVLIKRVIFRRGHYVDRLTQ